MRARASGRAPAGGTFKVAGIIALALALSVLAAGCGGSGSSTTASAPAGTSKQPYVLVPVLNDTSSTVEFIQCETTCAELHERRTLPAGGRNSILGGNENVPFYYLVKDMTGKRLGCVRMQFNHVKEAATVRISSMTACK